MPQTLLADAPAPADTAPYTTEAVAMTLAAFTYAASPYTIPKLLAGEQGTYATGTDWTLPWGPAQSSSNLMYLAYNQNLDTYAVVIAGSAFEQFTLATLKDLYEDLLVGSTVAWSYPPVTDAVIAKGTSDGLSDLLSLSSGGKTLTEKLSDVVAKGTTVWVVGHSLGGCLASVLAPYLQNQAWSGVTVTPYTFAAPTAGNQAFATFYTGLFGGSNRWFNDIDLVPMAWQDLNGMKQLFPGGPSCPFGMPAAIDVVEGLLKLARVSYAQPGAGSSLSGTVQSGDSWFAEVGCQHCHNTYLQLLGAPQVPFGCG